MDVWMADAKTIRRSDARRRRRRRATARTAATLRRPASRITNRLTEKLCRNNFLSRRHTRVTESMPDGSVANATVVNANPARIFNSAALRAVERWTFKPRTDNGTPTQEKMRRRIEFKF